MPVPPKVALCECWGRDGIQGWPMVLATEPRAEILNAAFAAGFDEVEVYAFVSPRVTAQFGDPAGLLALLERPPGARARVVVPNRRGVELSLEADAEARVITTIGFPISASESHNRANLGRGRDESVVEARAIVTAAHEAGLEVLGTVATAFGCPLEGIVPITEVLRLVDELVSAGTRRLILGDTTGLADPRGVNEVFSQLAARLPSVELIAHFHDTRGRGIANTLAALAAGASRADASLGGVGGEPDAVDHGHVGESGNVVTEDLVSVLTQMDVQTGVDVRAVLALGERVEALMGRRLRSQVLRSGPGLELAASNVAPKGRRVTQ